MTWGLHSTLSPSPAYLLGGPGPRLESWAYAVDAVGLAVLLEAGTFNVRTCKLCSDSEGIVVGGEYGIAISMLDAGYNFATLMSRYSRDVDWRDKVGAWPSELVPPPRLIVWACHMCMLLVYQHCL